MAWAVAAATLVAVAGSPGPPAHAAFPGANGRIAVNLFHDDACWLATVKPDGSDIQLVDFTPGGNSNPAFSPDGTRIAYQWLNPDRGLWEIWVVDVSDDELTFDDWTFVGDGEWPSWSPDGTRLAVQRDTQVPNSGFGVWAIWVLPADGDGPGEQLTHPELEDPGGGINDFTPSWSPTDADTVAFSRPAFSTLDGELTIVGQDIAAVSVSTGAVTRLTDAQSQPSGTFFAGTPDYSPDGSTIAFVTDITTGVFETIWLVSSGGGGASRVALSQSWYAHTPTWSPQGALTAPAYKLGNAGQAVVTEGVVLFERPSTPTCPIGRISWGPLAGAPQPDFTPTQVARGEFEFTPNVVGGEPPLTYAWDFGNGQTSDQTVGHVAYAAPGSYPVKLTVTDNRGRSASVTKTVEVAAPALVVGVTFPERASGLFGLDEEFVARVTIGATEGFGNLSQVRFTAAPSAQPPTVVEILEVPDDFPVGTPITLEPGELRSYDVRVRTVGAGTFTVAASATARDAADRAIGPVTGQRPGSVATLLVRVTPSKPEVAMGIPDGDKVLVFRDDLDGLHTVFPVTVEVVNTSDSTVFDVAVVGDLEVGPVEELEPDEPPYRNSTLAPDFVLDGLDLPGQPSGSLGSIDPGEANKKTLVYYLEALREGTSPLEVLVAGRAVDDSQVVTLGTGRVKVVQEVYVELRMKLDPNQTLPRFSGQAVRLVGRLKNTTADKTIAVFPAVYYGDSDLDGLISNATNGYLYPLAEPPAQTPISPQLFVLQPGQALDVGAIVGTLPNPAPTRAVLTYRLHASERKVDEEGNETWEDVSAHALEVDEPDEGWAHPVRVTLSGHEPEAFNPAASCGELWGNEYADWTWCGLVVGLENFVTGFAQLPELVRTLDKWARRLLEYEMRIVGLAFQGMLLSDDDARQQLVDEVLHQLESMRTVYGPVAWQVLTEAIPGAVVGYLAHMDQLYREGDPEFFSEIGRLTGENIDVFVEAPLKAGLKIATTVIIRDVIRPLPTPNWMAKFLKNRYARAAERIANGEPIHLAAEPGMDAEAYVRRLGYGDDASTAMKQVTKETNTIAVSKTRDPLADELIAQRKANPKSEQFKQKSAKQIDIDHLDVPAEWKAMSVVVEPPYVDALRGNLARAGLLGVNPAEMTTQQLKRFWAVLKESAGDWVATKGLNAEDAARLRARATERSFEFVHFEHNIEPFVEDWKKHGVAELLDPTKQAGLGNAKIRSEIVAFDLDVEMVNGRRVMRIRAGSHLDPHTPLPHASDPDMVFYFDPDTGQMASPAKRLEVMEKVYDDPRLGTTHGETGSLVDPTGTNKDKWMPPPDEVVLVWHPDGSVKFGRVVKFGDEFILLDGTKAVHYFGAYGYQITERLANGYLAFARTFQGTLWVHRTTRWIKGLYGDSEQPGAQSTPVAGFNRDGAVLNLAPDGTPARYAPSPTGIGTWRPITFEDALRLGVRGVMDPAPMTLLGVTAYPGATTLTVADPEGFGLDPGTGWFAPRDRVVLDPGGPNEEVATVLRVGSEQLVLTAPLAREHATGELVVLAPKCSGRGPTKDGSRGRPAGRGPSGTQTGCGGR